MAKRTECTVIEFQCESMINVHFAIRAFFVSKTKTNECHPASEFLIGV